MPDNYAFTSNLTSEQFTAHYLVKMYEYLLDDGWWGKDKIPKCNECGKVIPHPADLRRYFGKSLDSECFKSVWKKERSNEKRISVREYFDMVAQLDISSSTLALKAVTQS